MGTLCRWVVGVVLLGAVVTAAAVGSWMQARRSAPPIPLEELRSRYATPASRYVDVAGVRVHYQDEGSGPVLLLFHGSFGSLHTYDGVVPQLVDRFRVIRFDQPPTGLSGSVPEGFTMKPEDFVREFLRLVGVERVAVMGNSSGGIFAYRFAAAYPELVNAVVLVNVPPSAPVDNAAAQRRQSWPAQLSAMYCNRYSKPWARACWESFLDAMFVRDERVTSELVDQYYDYGRRAEARQLTSIAAIMRVDAEVIDFLGRVNAPVLVLWGSDSPVLPPPTADLLVSRLTGTSVELQRLVNVAHYPPIEAPLEVASAAGSFFDRARAAEAVALPR